MSRCLRFWCLTVLVLLAMLSGCGSTTANRIMVSGKVTFKGEPVADGTILFSPTVAGQFQANGVIRDGRYQIEADYGPSLGEYRVHMEGFRPTGKSQAAGPLYANEEAAEDTDSYIPAEFNAMTKLRVTISKENSAELDFNLDE